MITISITGPRGSGRTTTAIHIARLLRHHGQTVRFVGPEAAEKVIDESSGPLVPFSDSREFMVIDSQAESGELEQKLVSLLQSLEQAKSKVTPRLAAQLAEVVALFDETPDVAPDAFLHMSPDVRKACLGSLLALIAGQFAG